MHAEAVLLVDHRERQIGERDVVLEQRVGPDHDRRPAAGDLGQHRSARRRRARGR